MNLRPLTCSLLMLGAAAGLSSAVAADPVAVTDSAAVEEENMLDTSRKRVRGFTVWLGESVNDWFGDRPFEDGGKVTHGRLGLRMQWQEHEGWKETVRFRARFDLPNLKDKAYFFIGRQNERELVTDQSETFTREQQLLAERERDDRTGFVGLGYSLRKNLDLRTGVRGGYKVYAQARYRKQWMLSAQDRVEFRETVFWTLSDKFGSTTSLDYAHALSPTLSLNWQNTATISQKTDGFSWGSSLGLFKNFTDRHVLSGEMLVNGETGARQNLNEYGVRVKWQQPVFRDWLIGEVIVGHFWPQRDEDAEYSQRWAVGAGLEMRF